VQPVFSAWWPESLAQAPQTSEIEEQDGTDFEDLKRRALVVRIFPNADRLFC
jgi:hypothetical protein